MWLFLCKKNAVKRKDVRLGYGSVSNTASRRPEASEEEEKEEEEKRGGKRKRDRDGIRWGDDEDDGEEEEEKKKKRKTNEGFGWHLARLGNGHWTSQTLNLDVDWRPRSRRSRGLHTSQFGVWETSAD